MSTKRYQIDIRVSLPIEAKDLVEAERLLRAHLMNIEWDKTTLVPQEPYRFDVVLTHKVPT